MSKQKKKSGGLSPVERMEDMALTAKVCEALSPHLGGLTDKTLAEFVIHLTEKKIKKCSKENFANEIAQSKALKDSLTENGAPDIPLSLCKLLLEWTTEQSPRIKKWKRKQEEKAKKDNKQQEGPENALNASFPALAKANLNHSVPLEEDFYEHSEPEPRVAGSNPRGISNLPAWMTRDNDKGEPPSKKSRTNKEARGPQVHEIRAGLVEKVFDFGIRVGLEDCGGKECMVFKNKLPVGDTPKRFKVGQSVWVKILSISPTKVVLSMKDVDQRNGQDLLPHLKEVASSSGTFDPRQTASKAALSSTAVVHPGLDVAALKRKQDDRSYGARSRSGKQPLTEHELFEAQQLVRSGVLPVEQYPTYDPEIGMLAVEETEEETEVELNTELEPAFLRGQTKKSGRRDLEPVKIVKNPDGSLQRAAMQQSALAKERRELRQAQANQLIDSIPKDLNRPWVRLTAAGMCHLT